MNQADGDRMRSLLRASLTDAMKRRDTEAVRAYRSGIAAVDNAEAVPLREGDRATAIESAARGVGVADRPRRELDHTEVVEIMRIEVAERRAAAALVRDAHPDRAAALDREADLLAAVIQSGTGPAGAG